MKLTREQFDKMIVALDSDGDGNVTKEEFKVQIFKLKNYDKLDAKKKKELESEFDKDWVNIDVNKDNNLQVSELASYYGFDYTKNEQKGEMTDEQILEALAMQNMLYDEEKTRLDEAKAAEPKQGGKKEYTQAEIIKALDLKEYKIRGAGASKEIADLKEFWETCLLADSPSEVAKISKMLSDKKITAANVRFFDKDTKRTCLHNLAQWGLKDIIVTILEALEKKDPAFPAMFVNVQDKKEKTAIFYAAEYAHHDLVTYFISKGANVKVQSDTGWTVLHQAVNAYPTDDSDADFKTKEANSMKTIEALLSHTLLSDPKLKKELLDTPDRSQRTALHIAAFKSTEKVVQKLLENGANKAVTDNAGNQPVTLATKKGRRKSKELLESFGTG